MAKVNDKNTWGQPQDETNKPPPVTIETVQEGIPAGQLRHINLSQFDDSVVFVRFADGSTLERTIEGGELAPVPPQEPLTPQNMPSGMVGTVVDSARAAASAAEDAKHKKAEG